MNADNTDLEARIAQALACLAYADRCDADIAEQIEKVQQGKVVMTRIAPFAKAAFVRQVNESIALAESSLGTAAKSAAVARESVNGVLQDLLAEFKGVEQ